MRVSILLIFLSIIFAKAQGVDSVNIYDTAENETSILKVHYLNEEGYLLENQHENESLNITKLSNTDTNVEWTLPLESPTIPYHFYCSKFKIRTPYPYCNITKFSKCIITKVIGAVIASPSSFL